MAGNLIRISGVFEKCDPLPPFSIPTPPVVALFEPLAPGHYTIQFTATTDPAFGPDGWVELPDGSFVQAPIIIEAPAEISPAPEAIPNYGGLWWAVPAGSEAGWGINFAHQGDIIFASWFTYDSERNPLWLVMSAEKTAPGTYSGTLFEANGPPFDSVPFPPLGSPGGATGSAVGMGALTFSDANNGTFSYTVNGISQTKPISREVFGPLPNCTFGVETNLELATNYQDLWWAAPAGSESGWGINLNHQGDTIFATWYTYNSAGAPFWLTVTADKVAPMKYAGQLYQTAGPPFDSVPFPPIGSPGGATGNVVGHASFDFANGNLAIYSYTVNGTTQSKVITREVFASPGTVCQ